MDFLLPPVDAQILEEVGSVLGLRSPNERAIRTVAQRLQEHYDDPDNDDFFEGIVASATGVGKSYVISGSIEYFSRRGVKNFIIITPGKTIQNKTIAQFTPNNAKSITGSMTVQPLVIHSDNMNTSKIKSAFGDDTQIKLYIFTVQSLIKPGTEQGRKTHKYNEFIGESLYAHLQSLEDLIVFADEHHCYDKGKAFSSAVRGLEPCALVGLTATPIGDKKRIIFRYPLAAAIKDRWVKTPVIVGRRDDLRGDHIQLLDGGKLLRAKEERLRARAAKEGEGVVHPVMLVNCTTIEHAEEVKTFLQSSDFFNGEYVADDVVLIINSKLTGEEKERNLAALERVEEEGSPTRIIVQVGMLKEGWDVKNVYVIASLRSSVSDVLTEQTLGRGLRLPFGEYVDEDFLNQLEIVAHERYTDLLRQSGVLRQKMLDYETVIDSEGRITERAVDPAGNIIDGSLPGSSGAEELSVAGDDALGVEDGTINVGATEDRIGAAEQAAREKDESELQPLRDLSTLRVPLVKAVPKTVSSSLSDLTDPGPFMVAGRKLPEKLENEFTRVVLRGVEDKQAADGSHEYAVRAETVTVNVAPSAPLASPAEGRRQVVRQVMKSSAVASAEGESGEVERLLGFVLDGVAAQNTQDMLLTHYPDHVATSLISTINAERRLRIKHEDEDIVSLQSFPAKPHKRFADTSSDHLLKFDEKKAYDGWKKSLYEQTRFDSGPELELAAIIDDAPSVEVWVRLLENELGIPWHDAAGVQHIYNPDFLVLEQSQEADGATRSDYWIVEVKGDNKVTDDSVVAKSKRAKSWVNTANKNKYVHAANSEWHYIFVPESDLKAAHRTWSTIKSLGN